jgi:hypothetical protein
VSAPTTPVERPYFLMPEVERVLAITMAVAQELAVARTRIDSLERLLERKGVMTRAEIEGFEPTAAEAAERVIWTQDYIAHVLEALQRELDQLRGNLNAG